MYRCPCCFRLLLMRERLPNGHVLEICNYCAYVAEVDDLGVDDGTN